MAEMSNGKMVVMCNHADAPHVMPTLIMGASGVGIGEQVILFFCPGGAQAMVKGELEKIRDMKLKGLPDPIDLRHEPTPLLRPLSRCPHARAVVFRTYDTGRTKLSPWRRLLATS